MARCATLESPELGPRWKVIESYLTSRVWDDDDLRKRERAKSSELWRTINEPNDKRMHPPSDPQVRENPARKVRSDCHTPETSLRSQCARGASARA
jgi:hypothetical protein